MSCEKYKSMKKWCKKDRQLLNRRGGEKQLVQVCRVMQPRALAELQLPVAVTLRCKLLGQVRPALRRAGSVRRQRLHAWEA